MILHEISITYNENEKQGSPYLQYKAETAVGLECSCFQLRMLACITYVMPDRREEGKDGESRRRARKALLLSCWVFNEVERLPGLFLPAVVPTKPRYLALALCPAQATIPPND